MIEVINKNTKETIGQVIVDMDAIKEGMTGKLWEPKPESNRIKITSDMINDVRQLIKSDEKRYAFINKITAREVRAIHTSFLENDTLDARIADVFNSNNVFNEMLESIIISRLSYKLPLYKEVNDNYQEYYKETAKLGLIKTILNGLVALKYVNRVTKTARRFDEHGNIKYFTEIVYDFKGEEPIQNLIKGIHSVPGQLDSNIVHTKPGSKRVKLSSAQKKYLKKLSSIPLQLVDVSEDMLRAYYKQTKWYVNAIAKNIEDPILLDVRVEKYIETIKYLQKQEKLYLTNWFDSRLRVYYTLSMLGINPQGDSFETHMWQSAEPQIINEDGYKDLVWAAVVIAKGRKNKEQALKYWNKHEDEVIKALQDAEEHDFGELFYNGRLLDAIEAYRTGRETKFLLGFDYTTGGLQHFGTAFHSTKSMKASNMGGLKTVRDAHGELGDEFGLDRNVAKKINTPLLHGSSYKTISKVISEAAEKEYDVSEVREHIYSTYGEEIENIQTIAEWGTVAYDTNNSTLVFDTPDGEKAQSTCYFESVQLTVHGLEFTGDKMYSTATVHRDMPYFVTAKGEPLHDSPKVRGLYANITHTIDAWTLRQMDAKLYKHDKFYTLPNDMEPIREQGRKSAMIKFDNNYYVQAMKQIAERHVGTHTLPVPELLCGDATIKMIENSENFLMP